MGDYAKYSTSPFYPAHINAAIVEHNAAPTCKADTAYEILTIMCDRIKEADLTRRIAEQQRVLDCQQQRLVTMQIAQNELRRKRELAEAAARLNPGDYVNYGGKSYVIASGSLAQRIADGACWAHTHVAAVGLTDGVGTFLERAKCVVLARAAATK